MGAEACPACGASLTGTAPLPAAQWSATPGELTGDYDPVGLAGPGPVGGGAGWPHGGGTRFAGVAREVQRSDADHLTHLDFRVERHDSSGNRLAPVPVEMRGYRRTFRGTVSNGDEIQITHGEWHGGTLRVEELDNLTTGAVVRTMSAEQRAAVQVGPGRLDARYGEPQLVRQEFLRRARRRQAAYLLIFAAVIVVYFIIVHA